MMASIFVGTPAALTPGTLNSEDNQDGTTGSVSGATAPSLVLNHKHQFRSPMVTSASGLVDRANVAVAVGNVRSSSARDHLKVS